MDGGTISPDGSAARFPASLAQARFWLLDALDPGSPALNIAARWTVLGPLTPEATEAAWQHVIARHEVLRTSLLTLDGAPVQSVAARLAFHVRHHDLSALPAADSVIEADRLGLEEAARPFVLEQAPLIRVSLLTLEPNVSRMLVTVHHAVGDGWSIGVLANEFTAVLAGETLPSLALQYGDYAEWQQAWLASPALSAAKSYWLRQLAGLPYVTVPHDRAGAPRGSSRIASVLLPRRVSDELDRVARQHECTAFAVAFAALGRMLQSRTMTREIVVGTQIANRDEVELEPMVGCFINTLVLRLDLSGEPSWSELIGRSAKVATDAVQHGDLPFEVLIQALNPKRELGRTPLFSINFIFQRSFVAPPKRGNITLVDMPSHSSGALYDLNFFMVERPEGWRVSCEFDTGRYQLATVEAMLADWTAALTGESRGASPDATVEHQLAMLWQDVLGVPSVALDDDFFELGGHSLLAARLLARMEATFGRRVTMAQLFADATLRGLAERLQGSGSDKNTSQAAADQAIASAHALAFGTEAAWRQLAAALGPDIRLTCATAPSSEQLFALDPSKRLLLVASGPDAAAALGLAKALRRKRRDVLLILIEPDEPQQAGVLTRLVRVAGSRRFDGASLLFGQPGRQDAMDRWAAQLAGPCTIMPLPAEPWEAAVVQHIRAALA